jgi:uncharacterized membrane protein YeaQ/YmgE (transglycosylase-associated protein family)
MGFAFNSGDLFSSCFFYLAAGVIAGSVAQFIVRGRLGCLVGNFFLGIVGAIVANFLVNLIFPLIPKSALSHNIGVGFMGTVILASLVATLIALLFNWAVKAERQHQQSLLDRYRAKQPPTT